MLYGRAGRRWPWVILPVAVCLTAALAAGCAPGSPAPRAQRTRSTRPPPACQVAVPGFSCGMQQRIAAARRYLATAPGRIGLVLHDRVTGATWRNADAGRAFPAASTIKLAMVTDLLVRENEGEIRRTPADRSLIDAALRQSSDEAADSLWYAYENDGFPTRIRAFGMTGISATASPPHWGAFSCSAADLNNLMDYVLGRLPAGDRAEIVTDLRHVAPVQHWGVWGAGPASAPGNKNGWVHAGGSWSVSTVGFAGPGERYTLAIIDDLGAQAGFAAGANALTQVAAILFQGHQVPRPTVSATP